MESIKFEECNHTITDPNGVHPDVDIFYRISDNSVNFCLELKEEDAKELAKTRKLWVKQIIPLGRQMNPMRVSTTKEDIIQPDIEIIKPEKE